jgi:hypothetical protein
LCGDKLCLRSREDFRLQLNWLLNKKTSEAI